MNEAMEQKLRRYFQEKIDNLERHIMSNNAVQRKTIIPYRAVFVLVLLVAVAVGLVVQLQIQARWRRVTFINMTDLNQNYPQGLRGGNYSIRSCGRENT